MNTLASRSPTTACHLDLVRAAVLAPSPDNNQPWRFVSAGEQLRVYVDPERTLPSDVNGMFDLIGLGAAVENACIAARQAGFEALVDYGSQGGPEDARKPLEEGRGDGSSDASPTATITFAPGGQPDSLFPQLSTRCTCRKLYATRPVEHDSLRRLADEAMSLAEVQLDWIVDRPQIRRLARLVAATDAIRFQYEPFHNELFRQLRFSKAEAEQTRDGLDLRTLELPPGAGRLLRCLRPWNRMKWVHRLGLGSLLTLPSARSVRRSGAIGVLTVPEPTSRSFLLGGRAFQRVWLAATAEKLALHPLGSPAIFFAHVDQLQGRKLSQEHQQGIKKLQRRFADLVPEAAGRALLMLFRLGYSKPPTSRSLRREASEVMTAPPGENLTPDT